MKKTVFSKLGWTSLGLCGLCCALPGIGVALGFGALAAIAFYLEKAAFGFVVLAGLFFLIYMCKERVTCKSCKIDCGCKGNTTEKK